MRWNADVNFPDRKPEREELEPQYSVDVLLFRNKSQSWTVGYYDFALKKWFSDYKDPISDVQLWCNLPNANQ